jgi:hypothetical protein
MHDERRYMMCLSVAVHRPDDVLGQGEHMGYEWMIVNSGIGHRCGYVRVPHGHPWHGADPDNLDVDVHGGITFAAPDLPCAKDGPDDAFWFGFDCMHAGDAVDYDLPGEHHQRRILLARPPLGATVRFLDVVRTQEYVEAQCRSLCEQAAAAARGGA